MRRVKWLVAVLFGAFGLALSTAPASAQVFLGLSEIRGGPAISNGELIPGSLVIPQLSSFHLSNMESAQFDLYWQTPFPNVLRYLGSPRPFIGGIVSFTGRENSLHWGWQWHAPIGDTFYLEAAVGNGIHDGDLSGATPPRRNLGCRFLYHWSAGVGANVTDRITVTAQLQHMSNILAGCTPNDGMNHFGISVGWKF
jgi:hypothetical protein